MVEYNTKAFELGGEVNWAVISGNTERANSGECGPRADEENLTFISVGIM